MNRLTDMIKLAPAEPCEFSTSGGEGWYTSHMGELIRRNNALVFDLIDEETGEREPIKLVLEGDGFYHWRDQDGDGHWCLFLAETAAHTYLTGNWKSSDGEQGVSIFIWPSPEGETVQEKAPRKMALKKLPEKKRKGTNPRRRTNEKR